MTRRAQPGHPRARVVLVLSSALVVFGAVTAALGLTDRGGVVVHHAQEPSRVEMIRQWRALLEKDGRSLPDTASIMSTSAIREAWTREHTRQAKPSGMRAVEMVEVCRGWWTVFEPRCW